MRKFKKLLPALFASAPVALFAEGASNTIDTTVASGAFSDMVDAVKGFITTCAPYVVALLGVALTITLIWVGWKWLKRGTGKA